MSLTGMIQKRGGKIHEASLAVLDIILEQISRMQAPSAEGEASASSSPLTLLYGRLGDAMQLVATGNLDFAIVSCSALEMWRASAGEHCDQGRAISYHVLGPAACQWMMMVPENMEQRDWVAELKNPSGGKPVSIVTTSLFHLKAHLERHSIDTDALLQSGRIHIYDGGTETIARHLMQKKGAPFFIFDAVATGKTAIDHGFIPIADDPSGNAEREHDLCLIVSNRALERNEHLEAFLTAVTAQKSTIHTALYEIYRGVLDKANRRFYLRPDLQERMRRFTGQRLQQIAALYT